MRGDHKTFEVPAHQADAALNQAAPGDGVEYTVLDTTKNVRIISMIVQCTWTVQPTPLELHLTIDGVSHTYAMANPVSATPYIARALPDLSELNQGLTALTGSITDVTACVPFLIEGRSVKVTAEITGGTVSNLTARVKYAKW
jgi:hypothetical protein